MSLLTLLPRPTVTPALQPSPLVANRDTTTPPIVTTELKPLQMDTVSFSTPKTRSGVAGKPLFDAFVEKNNIKNLIVELAPKIEGLKTNRLLQAEWYEQAWANIPNTLNFLFSNPQPEALQRDALHFLQNVVALDTKRNGALATNTDKADARAFVNNFSAKLESHITGTGLSQVTTNPATFINSLVQGHSTTMAEPYALDVWKYYRVLFELALSTGNFNQAETYYKRLQTSVGNSLALYDGLKQVHPQILTEGLENGSQTNPHLYIPIYNQQKLNTNPQARFRAITDEWNLSTKNEQSFLRRIFADRFYLEPTMDVAGQLPNPSFALTYLQQAFEKNQEAGTVQAVITEGKNAINNQKEEALHVIEKGKDLLLPTNTNTLAAITGATAEIAAAKDDLQELTQVLKLSQQVGKPATLAPSDEALYLVLQEKEQALLGIFTVPSKDGTVTASPEAFAQRIEEQVAQIKETYASLIGPDGLFPDGDFTRAVEMAQKQVALLKTDVVTPLEKKIQTLQGNTPQQLQLMGKVFSQINNSGSYKTAESKLTQAFELEETLNPAMEAVRKALRQHNKYRSLFSKMQNQSKKPIAGLLIRPAKLKLGWEANLKRLEAQESLILTSSGSELSQFNIAIDIIADYVKSQATTNGTNVPASEAEKLRNLQANLETLQEKATVYNGFRMDATDAFSDFPRYVQNLNLLQRDVEKHPLRRILSPLTDLLTGGKYSSKLKTPPTNQP